MMGTYWELVKTRKIPPPTPLSNPKRKKICIRLNVEPSHWGHKNFISQNCWSPTWTNSTIVSILVWGTYYVVHCGILCFALIRWGASQVFSFFGQEASLIGPSPKTSKTIETP
jgi:hypothetical protein